MKFLIKIFSEISIKSPSVRKQIMRLLQRNIQKGLQPISSEISLEKRWDHFLLKTPDDHKIVKKISKKLEQISGIAFSNEIEKFPLPKFSKIKSIVLKEYTKKIEGKSFCVRVKRSGKHSFSSVDLEKHLGEKILHNIPNTKVQLKNPEYTVRIEIKDNQLFLLKNRIPGMGGFPIGAQEKVLLLLSGGFDSGVAAQMMMRKGCKVDFLFCNLGGKDHETGVLKVAKHLVETYGEGYKSKIFIVPFEEIVEELLNNINSRYRGILLKRHMMRVGNTIAKRNQHQALITGESLGQVSSQTLPNLGIITESSEIPIFRPLIGLDKPEIIERAEKIGTAEIAKTIPEYCGVVSKKPATAAKMEAIEKEEKEFHFSILEKAQDETCIKKVFDIEIENNQELEETNTCGKEEIILDIREEEERQELPLPDEYTNILEIPFYELKKRFPKLDKKKTYLLYCERGIMSKSHGKEMQEKGFTVKIFQPDSPPDKGEVEGV